MYVLSRTTKEQLIELFNSINLFILSAIVVSLSFFYSIQKFFVGIEEQSSQDGSASVDARVEHGSVARRHESFARPTLSPVLDEQFLQLQQLQDESSPNFVSEVVNIYFHESEKLLRNLRGLLL
ncbi:hypothetical protein ACSBR2_023514 [Camellia fascicularis]